MKILTVANRAPTEPYFCFEAFRKSLERWGYEPVILGWNEPWRGLMTKPAKYKEYFKQDHSSPEPVILCDAWDVVFAMSPKVIEATFRSFKGLPDIVWNAEKNLFPDPSLDFPETGTSYRYLNSGFAIGYPFAFRQLFDWMNLKEIGYDREENGERIGPNDQLYFQKAYLVSGIPMALDSQCEICQTLHGVKEDELDLTGDLILNKETGTHPMCFHLNGAKEIWKDKILTKLNL